MPPSPPKAVIVLDLDGTLLPHRIVSQWNVLEDHLFQGERAHFREEAERVRSQFLPKFEAGTITHEEYRRWYDGCLDVYFRAGLTPEGLRSSMATVSLRPGVKEFLDVAESEGIPTAVISYGIHQAVEGILSANNVLDKVHRVYSGRLILDGERFSGVERETVVLPADKGRCSLDFAGLHGVLPERILAIGDSTGDITLGHLSEHRMGVSDSVTRVEQLRQSGAFGEVAHLQDEHFRPAIEWLRKKIDAWK